MKAVLYACQKSQFTTRDTARFAKKQRTLLSEVNMENIDFREIIAKLLEDARRLNELEPNSGTQARIEEAVKALVA